jgi:hypothetical protein
LRPGGAVISDKVQPTGDLIFRNNSWQPELHPTPISDLVGRVYMARLFYKLDISFTVRY